MALYSYLPKEYDNLYTIDIVCHGVPSPKMWKDFLKMREKELHGKEFSSRVYTKLFYQNYLRPSCFQCVYANKNRPGDITIADFWGHEKAIPDQWDDEKGISLVLVNNSHGMEWWDAAKEELAYVDCTGYPFRYTNMKRPTAKPATYDAFWKEYRENGFEAVVKRYAKYEPQSYWKNRLKVLFKKK